jgi:glycine C-acetyltransferase
MYGDLKDHLQRELADIETAGLFKRERIITTPQDAVIKTTEGARS